MTEGELKDKVSTFILRKQRCGEKIATLARAIVPVLHDHQLHACAKPLDEALFELDAIEQEMLDLIKTDPARFFKAMLP